MTQFLLVFIFLVFIFDKRCCARSLPDSQSDTDGGRIVGGEDTTIEENPYQIALRFLQKHRCGGSLIKPNIVLTAAHCVVGYESHPNKFAVHAGSTFENSGGVTVAVTNISIHPKYDVERIDYDVSVLNLEKSFPLGPTIQTIALELQEILDGTLGKVTGWGATSEGGPSANILQKVKVPKVNYEKCRNSYPGLTDRMVCFGYDEGGKDSCQGDSGGPIAVNNKLVGVISWGLGCAQRGKPGVYAKLSNSEISQYINQFVKDF